MKGFSPYNWLEELVKSTDKERETICAGTPLPWKNSPSHARKITFENTWIFCAPGHFKGILAPRFGQIPCRKNHRHRPCERALPYRDREARNSHQRGRGRTRRLRLVPGGFVGRGGRQTFYFTLLSAPCTRTLTESTRLKDM